MSDLTIYSPVVGSFVQHLMSLCHDLQLVKPKRNYYHIEIGFPKVKESTRDQNIVASRVRKLMNDDIAKLRADLASLADDLSEQYEAMSDEVRDLVERRWVSQMEPIRGGDYR